MGHAYLDIDIVLVNICVDTVFAVVGFIAPNLAVFIGPCPVLWLLLAVPFILPIVVLPVVVVIPVIIIPVIVPVVACLYSFDLIVGLEDV